MFLVKILGKTSVLSSICIAGNNVSLVGLIIVVLLLLFIIIVGVFWGVGGDGRGREKKSRIERRKKNIFYYFVLLSNYCIMHIYSQDLLHTHGLELGLGALFTKLLQVL